MEASSFPFTAIYLSFPLSLALACNPGGETSALRAVVDGPWTSACLLSSGSPELPSYQTRLELSEASIIDRRERYFKDGACQELVSEVRFRGIFELTVTPVEYSYLVDISFDSVTAAALNSEGQTILEKSRYCGISEWPLLLEQNIGLNLTAPCRSFGVLPIKNWNIVSIKRGQSLTFGADLSADNLRPDFVTDGDPARSFVPLRLSLVKLSDWQK